MNYLKHFFKKKENSLLKEILKIRNSQDIMKTINRRRAAIKCKGRATQTQRTTSARAVRAAKKQNIIDCFCRPLPNGVHSVPAVGRWSGPSCGGPARSPSSPPSCRPAQAGLRRGFGRRHSVWRACWPVPPHFALAPDVVRNGWVAQGKMRKAAARNQKINCQIINCQIPKTMRSIIPTIN